MRLILLFVIIVSSITVKAQSNYAFSEISDELLENANAVVRDNYTLIELKDLDEMVITEKKVITVLNRFGDKLLDTYVYYDDSSKVLSLSALILDANGKEIVKKKYSDFLDVSAVSGGQMYTDNRVKYLDYTPLSYPYTVVFNYKLKEKSTAFIKSWYPVDSYYLSVEENKYEFINHTASKHKFKSLNTDFLDFTISEENNGLIFSSEKLKAIKREERSPSFNEIFPKVLVAINDFSIKGKKGNSKNWTDFGIWQYNDLLTGRDNLKEKTVEEVKQLLEGVNDKKEKVKRVYRYMQDRTRYVGVQLGIGGWQPINADEVDRVKYGDCKGLTNYTKALLKSQGLESYYTIVYAGDKRNIDKQFSSMQGNHVILNVPLENEEVWLECTSQTKPFNFLGDFTADRDVLVVTPNGGEIKRTPTYGEEINTLTTKAKVLINSEGKVESKVVLNSKGLQYDNRTYIIPLSEDKKELVYLDRWDYLNGLKLNSIHIVENKDSIELTEDISLSIDNYITQVGDKLMVQLNMFNRVTSIPMNYENRRLPFKISMSYKDIDEYSYQIPDGMKVTSLPEEVEIMSDFGYYRMSVYKTKEEKIVYKREMVMKEGVFPKEKYDEYRGFLKKIKKKDKLKILIEKSK
ncbi:DUF3857 domain-containing protein [Pseudofulvibacter geojedonensis]|uniref:DUF3857 domain-containing protein n=1 Tax=Pseudofulvibacter geojedonensis TaxID=1123758 RepID=A0ABW3I1P5_9FLAO